MVLKRFFRKQFTCHFYASEFTYTSVNGASRLRPMWLANSARRIDIKMNHPFGPSIANSFSSSFSPRERYMRLLGEDGM